MAQVRQGSHQPAEEVKSELSCEGPGVHSCVQAGGRAFRAQRRAGTKTLGRLSL